MLALMILTVWYLDATASGCISYLALRLPTDLCNLIVFAQTANPWNAVGFAQLVTKLIGSSPTNPTDDCFTGVRYIGGNATGKIALICRGKCLFHTKCINAQNAGAISLDYVANPPVTVLVVVIGAAIDASSFPVHVLTVLNVTYNC